MKFISLFAGIGGFDLGFERAGMECVAQVEIDLHAGSILKKNWPNVPLFKDVQDVGKHNLPQADVICGGFPCQDVSLAGKRAGLKGKRSTLWSEFHRITCEIRPRWIIIENVRGLYTSDNGEFFRKILWELASSGYDAEWDCLPAAFFGAPQLRHRVFIVAYPQGYFGGSTRFLDFQSENRANMGKHRRPASKVTWNGIQINRKDASSYTRSFPEPVFLRMGDGLSNELDKDRAAQRMKTTGNAVVPQVAEWIARSILQAESNPNLNCTRPAYRLEGTRAENININTVGKGSEDTRLACE